jgi:hypothetical protein
LKLAGDAPGGRGALENHLGFAEHPAASSFVARPTQRVWEADR